MRRPEGGGYCCVAVSTLEKLGRRVQDPSWRSGVLSEHSVFSPVLGMIYGG